MILEELNDFFNQNFLATLKYHKYELKKLILKFFQEKKIKITINNKTVDYNDLDNTKKNIKNIFDDIYFDSESIRLGMLTINNKKYSDVTIHEDEIVYFYKNKQYRSKLYSYKSVEKVLEEVYSILINTNSVYDKENQVQRFPLKDKIDIIVNHFTKNTNIQGDIETYSDENKYSGEYSSTVNDKEYGCKIKLLLNDCYINIENDSLKKLEKIQKLFDYYYNLKFINNDTFLTIKKMIEILYTQCSKLGYNISYDQGYNYIILIISKNVKNTKLESINRSLNKFLQYNRIFIDTNVENAIGSVCYAIYEDKIKDRRVAKSKLDLLLQLANSICKKRIIKLELS